MTQKPGPSPAGGRYDPSIIEKGSVPGSGDSANFDSQSVAGEEDPGASLDMPASSPDQPSSGRVSMPSGAMNPGDEAPEGTPGTGEDICRECGGSGRVGNNTCTCCNGSGKVIVGVGGA